MQHFRPTPGRLVRTAALALALAGTTALVMPALAQSRDDVIVIVEEEGPATLDIHGATANVPTHQVSWNVYDRLITHARIQLPDGSWTYDYTTFAPELAESWEFSEDGKSVTFHLRTDAVFHDGRPVTSADVKWSLDRAVSVGGFPSTQMGASEMTSPDQFVIIDEHTIRIDFPRPNSLILANLAVPVPIIINSQLALEHATPDDPWALEWVGRNDAGGGAYRVESWTPGTEIVFARFDEWKSGVLPEMERVISRQIASAGSRRALLERGDADLSFNLPPRDFAELVAAGELKIIGTPVDAELIYVDMNVTIPPFDNPLVRQAIAYAIPYDDIVETAMYGRGIGMFGGPEDVTTTAWPQPSPYVYDLDRARALLTEAGFPNGFTTTISYDLSTSATREPIALLIQDSLRQIGVTVEINEVPGANWYAQLADKAFPMDIMSFKAWLNYPEYYFYWTYHGGNNTVFNSMNYQNPALDALVDAARFEPDRAAYEQQVQEFIQIAFDEVPRIPLIQDFRDVAMQPDIEGYTYWFHLTLDFRTLSRAD